jgi:hypothetical protein
VRLLALLIAAGTALGPLTVLASAPGGLTMEPVADYHVVAAGSSIWVDEHLACGVVVNHLALPLFIPTKTAQEWNSFLSSTLVQSAGSEITDCCEQYSSITDCENAPAHWNCYYNGLMEPSGCRGPRSPADGSSSLGP